MSYLFHDLDESIKKTICDINDVNPDNLIIKEYNQELNIINEFKEKILSDKDKRFFIVGDYDCDGICATSIMKKLLDDLNIKVNYYIPSRNKEGYGLNNEIVNRAHENNFDCLLCVDNGIVANEPLTLAKSLGMKTYVIDHHNYETLPEVDALLHPDLLPDEYDDLCAAGLCALLSNSFRQDDLSTALGGLATLADMVSVFGYNRYLMNEMMNILNSKNIVSINYLLGRSKLDYDNLSYNVIPKINAVSRLDNIMNVNYVVRFLLNYDNEASLYLNKIEAINKTRKELTKQMSVLAERLIDTSLDLPVVCSDTFNEGLCGLVANRLMFEYNKPIIVLAKAGDELRGSGRCPQGFDLFNYLEKIKDHFLTYGGHAQAVGLSLKEDELDYLLNYIKDNPFEIVNKDKDVLLLNQESINNDLYSKICELKPFGPNFKEPLIGIKNVSYDRDYVFSFKNHKYVLSDVLEAIDFNNLKPNNDFDTMIGKIKEDDYHPGKLSIIIEDLMWF